MWKLRKTEDYFQAGHIMMVSLLRWYTTDDRMIDKHQGGGGVRIGRGKRSSQEVTDESGRRHKETVAYKVFT
jgi:hypothetical protein